MWFDPGMGMADDIRRERAEQQARDDADAAVRGAQFDRLVQQLDALMPEAASALVDLKSKPRVRLGMFKRGWYMQLCGLHVVVYPNGSWDFIVKQRLSIVSRSVVRAAVMANNGAEYGGFSGTYAIGDGVRNDVQHFVRRFTNG